MGIPSPPGGSACEHSSGELKRFGAAAIWRWSFCANMVQKGSFSALPHSILSRATSPFPSCAGPFLARAPRRRQNGPGVPALQHQVHGLLAAALVPEMRPHDLHELLGGLAKLHLPAASELHLPAVLRALHLRAAGGRGATHHPIPAGAVLQGLHACRQALPPPRVPALQLHQQVCPVPCAPQTNDSPTGSLARVRTHSSAMHVPLARA